MRRINWFLWFGVISGALVGWTARAAERPLPVRTAHEICVAGDWNGDGALDWAIVDRASGTVRVALWDSTGTYQWTGPFAGGISDVTSAAAGRLFSIHEDALALSRSRFSQKGSARRRSPC